MRVDADAVRAFVRDLPDYEQTGGSPFARAGAGLRRTERLLDLLGRPDAEYVVAQVAGTNGKGSTSAMLAAILEAAGARTGLFTSPHLRRWEERIRIGGRVIEDDPLGKAGGLVVDAARQLSAELGPLTRFEFWTALACVAFRLASCRTAVLEVGLGGRFDATTAARVDLAVITRIALDHTAVLGPSLADIAREKAAILREGAPAVCAPQEDEAKREIVTHTRALHARLLLAGRDFSWRRSSDGLAVTVLGETYDRLELALRAPYQDENGSTAVAAAVAASTLGVAVRPGAIRAGLVAARWPGRFELAGTVVLDGAHNPDGARVLVSAFRSAYPGQRCAIVLGCMGDKDLDGMLRELAPIARRLIAVRVASPRARAPLEIAAAARTHGIAAEVADSVADGLAAAGRDERVVVCGSLAVVGVAREALGLSE